MKESKKLLKETINPQNLENCNAWYQISKYNGEDFMIVDSWDDVIEIQKALDPSFEPKDKYDTKVLDDYMPWGFSDSYVVCDECGDVICTEPDSKHWKADFFVSDNGIVCGDCVREDPQDYIEYLVNNPNNANTILDPSNLEDEGFEKLDGDTYQSGYYGRNDDPKSILKDLMNKYPQGEFIFNVIGVGQFAVDFDVYGRNLEEIEESCKKNEGVVGGSQKEITRDMCKELESKIFNELAKNDIYPEDGSVNKARNSLADFEMYLIIDGDWKHDHLFAEDVVESYCKKNGLIVVKHEVNEIGESDSDWYEGEHVWLIDIDGDGKGTRRLATFRKMFN